MPDRERAVLVDQPDHLPVHLAGEHHPDHVHGLRRGDPQPGPERGLDAQPVELGADLRAAAVHDDRAQPRVPQEHHVLRERGAQRLVGHGVAAVLDARRSGRGTAPARAAPRSGWPPWPARPLGTAPPRSPGRTGWPSRGVRRVLVDVRRRSGRWSGWWPRARPADRSTVMVTSRGLRSTPARSSAGGAVPADPDAVDGHVQLVRLEDRAGGADRGQHAAPVRVLAVDRALEQVAPGDGPADGRPRRPRWPRRSPRSRWPCSRPRRPAASAGPGRRRPRPAARRTPPGRAGRRRRRWPAAARCRWSTCSRRCPAGRTWSAHRVAQRGVQLAGRQVGVGGEHDQHRGQRRGQHGGALGHAADHVARARHRAGLGHRVGGPDRVGRGRAAVRRRRGHRGVDPGQQLVHGQPLADQAGRADGDLARADSPRRLVCPLAARAGQHLGQVLGGVMGVGEPGRARCTRWRRRS